MMKIVFIAHAKWGRPTRQRPQKIAYELSKKFPILWIDRADFFLKSLFRAFAGNHKLVERVNQNFYVARTFVFMPRGLKISRLIWFFLIKAYEVLFLREYKDTVYFISGFVPGFPFKGKFLVYDRCDRYYEFRGAPKKAQLDDIMLSKKADLVVSSSKSLFEESSRYNKDSVLARNGVDPTHFQKVLDMEKVSNKKVIGYIGAVRYWVDFGLLKKLAQTYQEYELHIIGPCIKVEKDKGYMDLLKMRNVKFFGRIPYSKLPEYLKEFDVAIIPFIIDEATKAVDPIKVYDYMAAGKSVVSTDLPELHRLKDYIYIAENEDDFVEMCGQAIRKPKRKPEELIRIAKENTWERRVEQIETEIRKRIKSIET